MSSDGSDEDPSSELGHTAMSSDWGPFDGWFTLTFEEGAELLRSRHNTTDQPLSGIMLCYVTPGLDVTEFCMASYRGVLDGL